MRVAPPQSVEEIRRRRDEVIARWGPWRSSNIRLAEGVFTMPDASPGDGARVRRALQHVRDLASGTVSGLRVLDLGCGEGGLALELGRHGSDVVAMDGRLAQIEKAELAREILGVRSMTVAHVDARRLSVEEHGFFDVVIALSLLDRLDAPAVFDVVKRIAAVCKRFALIESRLAPRGRATREFEGAGFRGAPRREHRATSTRAERLAALDRSLDNDQSFLLTRESMLRLLGHAGFTSVAELLDPDATPEAPWLAAFHGRRAAITTAPQVNAEPPATWKDAPPRAGGRGIGRILRRRKR
jgi:SAM-dependent methyltransferase